MASVDLTSKAQTKGWLDRTYKNYSSNLKMFLGDALGENAERTSGPTPETESQYAILPSLANFFLTSPSTGKPKCPICVWQYIMLIDANQNQHRVNAGHRRADNSYLAASQPPNKLDAEKAPCLYEEEPKRG